MTTPSIPAKIDVAAIRNKLRLTQIEFALRFGLNVKSVRAWERKRQPDAAARALLTAISREPETIYRLLSAPAQDAAE